MKNITNRNKLHQYIAELLLHLSSVFFKFIFKNDEYFPFTIYIRAKELLLFTDTPISKTARQE